MLLADLHAYQSAFRHFASLDDWRAPHAVTLTLKQGIPVGNMFAKLTRDDASANFRHFINRLERDVLGKAATRYGQKLNRIAVIEGGNGTRLHIHATIDCPDDDRIERFPAMIANNWVRTQWGHREINIQRHADGGWINYISKLRDKPSYVDAIDWQNCHLSDRRV